VDRLPQMFKLLIDLNSGLGERFLRRVDGIREHATTLFYPLSVGAFASVIPCDFRNPHKFW